MDPGNRELKIISVLQRIQNPEQCGYKPAGTAFVHAADRKRHIVGDDIINPQINAAVNIFS